MKKNSGFTLVELVLSIAIISILVAATISIINPFEVQKNSRDSIRVANLNSISQALELYYAQNKNYPTQQNLGEVSSAIQTALKRFNSRLSFTDPSGCSVRYTATASSYTLYLPQESTSFALPAGQTLITTVPRGTLSFTPSSCNSTNVFKLTGSQ